MRKRALLAAVTAAVVSVVASSQQQKAPKKAMAPVGQEEIFASRADLQPATIAGEVAAARISDPSRTADWPAIAAAPDGSLWTIYIEWNGQDRDRVLVRRQTAQGQWRDPIEIGRASCRERV